jgi:hypothetical protein
MYFLVLLRNGCRRDEGHGQQTEKCFTRNINWRYIRICKNRVPGIGASEKRNRQNTTGILRWSDVVGGDLFLMPRNCLTQVAQVAPLALLQHAFAGLLVQSVAIVLLSTGNAPGIIVRVLLCCCFIVYMLILLCHQNWTESPFGNTIPLAYQALAFDLVEPLHWSNEDQVMVVVSRRMAVGRSVLRDGSWCIVVEFCCTGVAKQQARTEFKLVACECSSLPWPAAT